MQEQQSCQNRVQGDAVLVAEPISPVAPPILSTQPQIFNTMQVEQRRLSPFAPNSVLNKEAQEEDSADYGPGGFYDVKQDLTLTGTLIKEYGERVRMEIKFKLGRGQYATVYGCRQYWRGFPNVGDVYAVKVLRSADEYVSAGADEIEVMRSVKEISDNSRHEGRDGFIRLHDVFIEDHKPSINHICIIMELGCESLRDLLNRSGALPLALMPYIAKQLLTSLQFLHEECHLIHCDLKSTNIYLTHKGIQEFIRRVEAGTEDGAANFWRGSDPDLNGPVMRSRPIPVPSLAYTIHPGAADGTRTPPLESTAALSDSIASSPLSSIASLPSLSPASSRTSHVSDDTSGKQTGTSTSTRSSWPHFPQAQSTMVPDHLAQSTCPVMEVPYDALNTTQAYIDWLSEPLKLKIGDLALAKPNQPHEPEPDSDMIVPLGSVEYRAPECWKGFKSWDAGVDVWALGCIMYECFTSDLLLYRSAVGPDAQPEDEDFMNQIGSLIGNYTNADAGLPGNYTHKLVKDHEVYNPLLNRLEKLGTYPLEALVPFVAFLERMLTINVSARATVSELLPDPFITKSNLPESVHVRYQLPGLSAAEIKRRLREEEAARARANWRDDPIVLGYKAYAAAAKDTWHLLRFASHMCRAGYKGLRNTFP